MNGVWPEHSERAIVRLGELDWYFSLYLLEMDGIAKGAVPHNLRSPGPSDALRPGLRHRGQPNRDLRLHDRVQVPQLESGERSSNSR